MKTIFWLLEKLFGAVVLLPPVYIAYRFVKWYLKQSKDTEEV
jgi:hypothetical protein